MSVTDSVAADEFLPMAEPYRRELLAHCYRMLGSLHDAEDMVQETYLRAWRAYDRFEGRSSLRTWLYQIATNACLTALQGRSRRPLPSGLGTPAADPGGELAERTEVPWLEPVPDAMVGAWPADPANVVTSRESIRLAFIAALQYLPARQRAVLVLREVLNWRAAEVADALGTTSAAVNSMLQRARAQISNVSPDEGEVAEPDQPEQRQLLDDYVAAFENYDVPALVKLFSKDAVWEMPPFTTWYQSPEAIGSLVSNKCPANAAGDMRMVAVQANGQAAFAMYMRDESGQHRAFNLHVVHTTGGSIDHVVAFFDTSLFAKFDLPEILPAGGLAS